MTCVALRLPPLIAGPECHVHAGAPAAHAAIRASRSQHPVAAANGRGHPGSGI